MPKNSAENCSLAVMAVMIACNTLQLYGLADCAVLVVLYSFMGSQWETGWSTAPLQLVIERESLVNESERFSFNNFSSYGHMDWALLGNDPGNLFTLHYITHLDFLLP